MVARHDGFVELYTYDLDKGRGGDFSRRCFAKGNCRQLKRRQTAVCDSGKSRDCDQVVRKYLGRWYVPFSRKTRTGYDLYGEDRAMRNKFTR